MPSAVIVGAGLGGLGTGIHLARQGWDVRILERNLQPGGRMSRIDEQGFRIDMGPTLLMMPEVLQSLFAACGRDVQQYIPMRRLEPSYEVRFADGARLAMGRLAAMPERIAALSPRDARRFPALIQDMERKYRVGRRNFIERPFNDATDLLRPATLTGIAQSLPLESVWSYVARFCEDPRLRQALTFQALYLGTSPFDCPAIYGFLPYIEMQFGVWFPEGGMYAVAAGLARLFEELGGRIERGTGVEEIIVRGGSARGVRTERGESITADAVISNCDVQTTYTQLIDAADRPRNTDARLWKRDSGCSAYLLYLGVRRVPEGWGHHTVVLPDAYEGVMHDLFQKRSLPRAPALYTCVPTLTDPSLAPKGQHVLYVLAPVPHLDSHVDWVTAAPEMRRRCLHALTQAGWDGLEEAIVFEREWTPADFLRQYGLFRGSAFGLSCTFGQSAFFRPHQRSEDIRNLYLVGASTHPGGGVPIVLTSAQLVAAAVQRDAGRLEREPDVRPRRSGPAIPTHGRPGRAVAPAEAQEAAPRGR